MKGAIPKAKRKIHNKIEDKITQSVRGTVPSKTKHTEIDGENSKEIPKFRYISSDKRQQIIEECRFNM